MVNTYPGTLQNGVGFDQGIVARKKGQPIAWCVLSVDVLVANLVLLPIKVRAATRPDIFTPWTITTNDCPPPTFYPADNFPVWVHLYSPP
jgi:hypothetical protein